MTWEAELQIQQLVLCTSLAFFGTLNCADEMVRWRGLSANLCGFLYISLPYSCGWLGDFTSWRYPCTFPSDSYRNALISFSLVNCCMWLSVSWFTSVSPSYMHNSQPISNLECNDQFFPRYTHGNPVKGDVEAIFEIAPRYRSSFTNVWATWNQIFSFGFKANYTYDHRYLRLAVESIRMTEVGDVFVTGDHMSLLPYQTTVLP